MFRNRFEEAAFFTQEALDKKNEEVNKKIKLLKRVGVIKELMDRFEPGDAAGIAALKDPIQHEILEDYPILLKLILTNFDASEAIKRAYAEHIKMLEELE